jgi:hypothetical protein
VVSPSPYDCSLSQLGVLFFSRLLRHSWKEDRGAILLFCPGQLINFYNLINVIFNIVILFKLITLIPNRSIAPCGDGVR